MVFPGRIIPPLDIGPQNHELKFVSNGGKNVFRDPPAQFSSTTFRLIPVYSPDPRVLLLPGQAHTLLVDFLQTTHHNVHSNVYLMHIEQY